MSSTKMDGVQSIAGDRTCQFEVFRGLVELIVYFVVLSFVVLEVFSNGRGRRSWSQNGGLQEVSRPNTVVSCEKGKGGTAGCKRSVFLILFLKTQV